MAAAPMDSFLIDYFPASTEVVTFDHLLLPLAAAAPLPPSPHLAPSATVTHDDKHAVGSGSKCR